MYANQKYRNFKLYINRTVGNTNFNPFDLIHKKFPSFETNTNVGIIFANI